LINTQHLPTLAAGTRPDLARRRSSSGQTLRNAAACSRLSVSILAIFLLLISLRFFCYSSRITKLILFVIDRVKFLRFLFYFLINIGLCELSALWSHFVSGVMAPVNVRRNGATLFPA
jgi:hypothetical protein